MSHTFWLRYLQIGEQLAHSEPDFFPTVVCLLETIASGDALGTLIHDVLNGPAPDASRTPSAALVGDLLCLADESLADVADFYQCLANLSDTQRHTAETWARETLAARGDRPPVPPDCVAQLYDRRRY